MRQQAPRTGSSLRFRASSQAAEEFPSFARRTTGGRRLNDTDHAARWLGKANDNRRAGRDPACIKGLRLCRTKKKALPNRRKKPAFLWSSHRMAKKSCDPKTLCKNSRYLPCFGNDRGIPPDPPHNAFLSGDGILLCQQFGKAAPPVFGNEALSEAPHLFREGSGDAPPDEALHHRQRDAADGSRILSDGPKRHLDPLYHFIDRMDRAYPLFRFPCQNDL